MRMISAESKLWICLCLFYVLSGKSFLNSVSMNTFTAPIEVKVINSLDLLGVALPPEHSVISILSNTS